MKTNVVAGKCLKEILENIYPNEKFIPFNEAMIKGNIIYPLFSDAFIEERIKTHNTTKKDYLDNMNGYINLLNHVDEYDEIILWFGDEPFCNANRKIVIESLRQYNYSKKITTNIVDELNGKILKIINE